MKERSARLLLEDAIQAIETAIAFTEGRTFDEFWSDRKTQLAIERLITIIGEAVKHLPQHVRDSYPDVPWRHIAGMRDRLVHDYPGADLKIIYETVSHRFPTELTRLKLVLGSLPTEENSGL